LKNSELFLNDLIKFMAESRATVFDHEFSTALLTESVDEILCVFFNHISFSKK